MPFFEYRICFWSSVIILSLYAGRAEIQPIINNLDIICIIESNLIQSFHAFQAPLQGCLCDAFYKCRIETGSKTPKVESSGVPCHHGRVPSPSVSMVSIIFHIHVNLINVSHPGTSVLEEAVSVTH